MSTINALRNSLDRANQNAKSGMYEAMQQAAETCSPEDFDAYNDAARRAQVTGTLVAEELRAQHGLTKAIIDGVQ